MALSLLEAAIQGRQRGLLRALQTPLLGRLTAHGLGVAARLAHVGLGGRVDYYLRPGPPPAPGGSPRCGGLLPEGSLESLYIGRSPIHGRGLFTRAALPEGTRILAEPCRVWVDAAGFLRLFADAPGGGPETWHYTPPGGRLAELALQALPHHLLNHGCEANVCSGLSPVFWAAARASGSASLQHRLTHWPHFDDPNSFFLTRDVRAGEELVVDYGLRLAPLVAGEEVHVEGGGRMCRCAATTCRHIFPRVPLAVQRYLHHLTRRPAPPAFEMVRTLMGMGMDEETTLLSVLPSPRPAVTYLRGGALPELQDPRTSSSAEPPSATAMERRRATKRALLSAHRQVCSTLNEAKPLDFSPAGGGRHP